MENSKTYTKTLFRNTLYDEFESYIKTILNNVKVKLEEC